VPLKRFFRLALSHTTAALIAASLVASCAMTGDAQSPLTASAPGNDASAERVILQTYRLIGDRHLYTPDFRKI
jgi:carboxyl-terminal processing protease